jgi:predicted aspartyl protease
MSPFLEADEVGPPVIPLEKKLTSEEFGHFLIPVEADSSKLKLILDTGSKLTVLSKSELSRTYKPNGFAFNTSMHGNKNRMRTIFLDRLTIGHTIIPKPRVALSELTETGLLGMDVLRESCFELNTKTPSLSIMPTCILKDSEKLDFFSNDLVVLQVKLNDKVYPMIFDTGASITVIDEALPWQEFSQKLDVKSVRIVDSARQKNVKEIYLS